MNSLTSSVAMARTKKNQGASAPVTGFVKSRRGAVVYLGLAGHKTALKALWATVVDRSRSFFDVGPYSTFGVNPREGGKYRQFWTELPEVCSYHCVVALEDLLTPDPRGERPFYVVVFDDGSVKQPLVEDMDVAERGKPEREWEYETGRQRTIIPLYAPGTRNRVAVKECHKSVLAVDCPEHWAQLRAAAERVALERAAEQAAHSHLVGLLNQADAAPFLPQWSAYLWKCGWEKGKIQRCSMLGEALAAFEIEPGAHWSQWVQEGLREGQLHFA